MKKAPTKSVLDNPNVTASQGLDLAEEMFNKSQRELTGGVDYIDVSRYQVTLHRLFAPNIPDWTGEGRAASARRFACQYAGAGQTTRPRCRSWWR